MAELIPISEQKLRTLESRVAMLLPQAMRSPLDVRVLASTPVALTGLYMLDGVMLQDGDVVVPVAQADGRQNGPWAAHAGAWTRLTATAVAGGAIATGALYRVTAGSQAGRMWIIREPEPAIMNQSSLVLQNYGTNRYADYYIQAEEDIWRDLYRDGKPVRPEMVRDKGQLTMAKVYATLQILYRQASENSQDGAPDRHERLARYYRELYLNELRTGTLDLVDSARVRPQTVRIVRG